MGNIPNKHQKGYLYVKKISLHTKNLSYIFMYMHVSLIRESFVCHTCIFRAIKKNY